MKTIRFILTLKLLFLWASTAHAQLVVDLDARDLDEGAIPIWTNSGALGGKFVSSGSPSVTTIDSVRGVTYNGSSWHVGPRSTPEMDGSSDRSIQVWLYNPAIASEETVVSWGHRGGPDGSNMSFNHGTHNAFGAIGHWGNGPDIGWDPSATADDANTGLGQEEAAIWTNIAYTQTGSETRVFTNGILTTSEEVDIDTHADQVIVIAAQQNAENSNTFTLGGSLTIAKVQIWDKALPDGQIAFNYNLEAANFGRDLAAIADSDGDGLPDDMEIAIGLNPNVADANGDKDGDGVSNLDELQLGSNLTLKDSDGDGLNDGAELAAGTSLTNFDTDGDGLTDKQEIDAGLDPTSSDTDGDGAPDNVELDAGTDPKDAGSSPNTIILVRDTNDGESWETPGVWSSGAAAEVGKPYIIASGAGSKLNTPNGARASFPANAVLSLTDANAQLVLDNRDGTHFDDLRIEAGTIALARNRGGLSGKLTVSGDITIDLDPGDRLEIASALSGSGTLRINQPTDSTGGVAFTGSAGGFDGSIWSNGAIVEIGGRNALGTADLTTFEGGIDLRSNVLLPTSTFSVGGVAFKLKFNGKTAVFKTGQGVNSDGEQIFPIDPGVYDRAGLLALGFNEDTVLDDGLLVLLGSTGDTDNDGLWDQWERDAFGGLAETAIGDKDSDGLSNADEFRLGSNPLLADTDGDGLTDGKEADLGTDLASGDTDGDGVSDADEVNRQVGGQPAATNPTLADTDSDRLNDKVETNSGSFVSETDSGTDPLVADTDDGGWPDGDEVFVSMTNPLDPADEPPYPPGVKILVDAADLPVGDLSAWTNLGGLGGEFVAEGGNPVVEVIGGAKSVTFDGGLMRGPEPSEDLLGNSSRTIEAWVYNPEIESEETVISWGRRGGPNGTNISFNHGTHNAFGAIGHWGGEGPDIGWDPGSQADDAVTDTAQEEAGVWTFIAYTYNADETLTSVYTNGRLTNTEDISIGAGNEAGVLDTWGVDTSDNPLNILLASQNDDTGAATGNLRGIMSIAVVRVYAGALTEDQIAANFDREADRFGRADSDGDGLGDRWELANFGNLGASSGGDPDGDDLDNAAELAASTDPNNEDSDGDGANDADELAAFTDPNDPASRPTAAVLVVSLDATGLDLGSITSWENTGSLGNFQAEGNPEVIEVDGIKGVNFDGANAYFEGPTSTPEMEGRSPRTIEAWVHNPDIAGEETVVSWARRGGGDGTNVSFNHGTNGDFGAVGHWGSPDIGWNGDQEANIWTHIAYTYDGNTTRVYTNGVLSNSENVILNTAGGNGILIAAQREADNVTVTAGLRGSMTIAKVRIYDGAQTASDIVASYNSDATQFGRELAAAPKVLVVNLDATGLNAGALAEWENAGSLGNFNAGGDPEVISVNGINGVDFDGDDYFEGPASTANMEGSSPRTIEAWVYNPEIASEETVVSWGFRGGPDGTNISFNHGTHNTFGAVGHWGAPDIGWDPTTDGNDDNTGSGHEETGIWSYITYTYDGATTRVYTNGSLSNAEDVVLNTHGGNNILIAAQRDSNGGPVTAGLRGDMTIARVRIWEGALSAEEIAATWDAEAGFFGRFATLVELDASGLPMGAIASWVNSGTLGGEFVAQGNPMVESIAGARGVTLDGTGDWLIGPTTPPSIEGSSARTIEAWVYNPEIAEEETVVSWGRRGGPDGSNVSFNHGTHETFGAVGHWGAPDIGWGEEAGGPEEAGKWTHIAYTQDGSTTRVYTNGSLTNSEEGITLNTHAGQGIIIGAQWDDATTVNEALSGSLSVGFVRIYDGALSGALIAAAYNETLPIFAGSGPVWFVDEISRIANGNVSLTFRTIAGRNYTIQYSVTLETWTDLGNIAGDGNAATFTDNDAARIGSDVGYYRIGLLP